MRNKLERRMQCNTRNLVNGLLHKGFTVVNRDPIELHMGNQKATVYNNAINYGRVK
jgi:hypothetical protein